MQPTDRKALARQIIHFELVSEGYKISHINVRRITELANSVLASDMANNLVKEWRSSRRKCVYYLRTTKGMTFKQIAARLNISPNRARDLFAKIECKGRLW